MPAAPWEPIDAATPGLAEARLALHHAVQAVAAPGQSLGPRAADDGQQALTLGEGGLWLGAPVAGGAVRAGLDPVALELFLCDGEGVALASLPLAGRTLADGLAFLSGELERRGHESWLSLPPHPEDFPRHPLGAGAPFAAGGEAARRALARLFAGTAGLLAEVVGAAAPPRLWPHHFDLAITLACGGTAFGLGVSPGDEAGPYWYVTVAPPPPRQARPPLAGGGRWREAGWAGAELPLAALPAPPARGEAQRAAVAAFYASALGRQAAP